MNVSVKWASSSLIQNRTNCQFSIVTEYTSTPTFAYYINGPLLFIIVAIGFIGNTLCLVAFSRSRRPPQINYYLINLSSWDLCLVIGSFFLYNLPYLLYGRVVTQGAYVLVYPFIYAVACGAHSGSIWAIIASGMDRYFALCHPITHKVYTSAQRTLFTLIFEAAFVLLFNFPRYYELETARCFDAKLNHSIPFVRTSELRADPVYYLWYKVIGGLIFFSLGPLVTLIFVSIKVWLAVQQLTKDLPVENKAICSAPMGVKRRILVPLKKPTSVSLMHVPAMMNGPKGRSMLRRHSTLATMGQESQYALNSMLLIVIVKFVVCHSLPTALDICEATMPVERFNASIINNIIALSNFLVVCNSSVNFFIYCACSQRFRRDLALFFKRRRSCDSTTNAIVTRLSDTQCKTTFPFTRNSFNSTSDNCKGTAIVTL